MGEEKTIDKKEIIEKKGSIKITDSDGITQDGYEIAEIRWISDFNNNVIRKIVNGVFQKRIDVGKGPGSMVVDNDYNVYVINHLDKTLSIIKEDSLIDTIKLGHEGVDIDTDNKSVIWIVTKKQNKALKFDMLEKKITVVLDLDFEPYYIVYYEKSDEFEILGISKTVCVRIKDDNIKSKSKV